MLPNCVLNSTYTSSGNKQTLQWNELMININTEFLSENLKEFNVVLDNIHASYSEGHGFKFHLEISYPALSFFVVFLSASRRFIYLQSFHLTLYSSVSQTAVRGPPAVRRLFWAYCGFSRFLQKYAGIVS
jgi:hypothetical protein